MFRRSITLGLLVTILNLAGSVQIFANPGSETDATKVKNDIQKLGTGADAKVTVTLKDKTRIKGSVVETDNNSFTVETTNRARQTIEYSQVKKVKGRNLSTGAKIAIGIGVAIGVLAIAVLANRKICKNTLCN